MKLFKKILGYLLVFHMLPFFLMGLTYISSRGPSILYAYILGWIANIIVICVIAFIALIIYLLSD